MKKYLPHLLLFLSTIVSCNNSKKDIKEESADDSNITTIAFGSCTHQGDDDQFWGAIAAQNPDIFIQLGDNIYGDTHDMKTMKAKYDQQKSRSSYQKLLNTTKVIGTWDDHDYGVNDGGMYYSKKDSSKLLFMDFLDLSADNPINSHKGVYNSYNLIDGDNSVKFILLDTRYFRDTLEVDPSGMSRYLPNKNGDILGEGQWEWLEKELATSKAEVNIIGSSIQVIATQQGFEKWGNFPKARKRLFDLIAKTSPKNPILMSGDRHIAELSAIDLEELAYPLYDFTSSGLTHTWSQAFGEDNRYRVGDLIIAKNYGLIFINWASKEITLEVKGKQNNTLLLENIPMYE